jgi:hypothetical protein
MSVRVDKGAIDEILKAERQDELLLKDSNAWQVLPGISRLRMRNMSVSRFPESAPSSARGALLIVRSVVVQERRSAGQSGG